MIFMKNIIKYWYWIKGCIIVLLYRCGLENYDKELFEPVILTLMQKFIS